MSSLPLFMSSLALFILEMSSLALFILENMASLPLFLSKAAMPACHSRRHTCPRRCCAPNLPCDRLSFALALSLSFARALSLALSLFRLCLALSFSVSLSKYFNSNPGVLSHLHRLIYGRLDSFESRMTARGDIFHADTCRNSKSMCTVHRKLIPKRDVGVRCGPVACGEQGFGW